ncbi:serine hydrolase [Aquimarina sp. 2201CG5-10]|uniref:serine hydrolase n=1 Tax=Aquimarina callyspongiae TaxID=3098150 RepID=UPI002AB5C58A|nr:serine hydrolase [Aquimarina sp. 2201CG5-10]MDY8137316.1 serine hydrolase [Aquimarina sp. 2201CG5-10]
MIIFFQFKSFSNSLLLENDRTTSSFPSNGSVAYAYPITNITIDGNAEDWPKNLQQFPIANFPFGNTPKNEQDFKAHFQIGYNISEESLYILVTVVDDSYVVDNSENADWNTQDSYNLYIDGQHSPRGSGLDLYQFSKEYKEMMDSSTSWDPSTRNHNWDNVKIVTSRKNTTTYYECKIKLKEQIIAGKTIGIDHVIIDKDEEDDQSTYSFTSWGKGGGKSQSSNRLGDVILLNKNQQIATITGQIRWKDISTKGFPDQVRLTSTDNPILWTQAAVDSTGIYNIDLPPGSYDITVANPIYYQDDEPMRIQDKNKLNVVVGNKQTQKISPLELSFSPVPEIIPEKGILHNFDETKSKTLDKFINTYQEYYGIPGVSLALIKEGKVIYHKTYGVKNTLTQEKVDDKTLFEAASITKPVFGFAVMRLVERGVIDLDKPLYEYLPFEAIEHDERYKLITARHVLSHKTGFPNWAWMNDDGKLDIKFTPGTEYRYSGEGFEYLKRVVAHITDKDMTTLLKEEVLDPLDLKHTYFKKNEYLQKVVANGHFSNYATRASLPDNPGMAWSMHTEAKTFSNYLLGLSVKKGLKPETYKEMFSVQTKIPKEEKDNRPDWEEYFGLSIHLQKTPYGLSFGHGGNNGDFKCEARMYQDLNMGYVIFTNSNTGDKLNDALLEFLITGKK